MRYRSEFGYKRSAERGTENSMPTRISLISVVCWSEDDSCLIAAVAASVTGGGTIVLASAL